MKRNPPKTAYRTKLVFHQRQGLFMLAELELGIFENISQAEHIRKMMAASNPKLIIRLLHEEIPNPRLSLDLSCPNDYRVY